jgi:hypothetical protein
VSVEAAAPRALPGSVACAIHGDAHTLHLECVLEGGGLAGCVACAHPELYTQKDFPRVAGLGIVIAAAVLAPFTAYVSLLAAALVDALLYRLAPDVVVCYVCRAQHRGFAREPAHPRFDREIEERLRYGERAVMGKPMRAGGTAGAPDPEH